MLELVLIPQAVHVLVPPQVQPAGLIDHQVGPLGVLRQAGVVIPELQLAPSVTALASHWSSNAHCV